MRIHRFRDVFLGPVVLAICAGIGGWLLATPPVRALVDSQQLLAGGGTMAEGTTLFTAPGHTQQLGVDTPGAGLGEQAAQVRMPAGRLGILRVSVTTATVPDSGALTMTVRVNGADTVLSCQIAGTGFCTKNASVTVRNNDLLAIRISNNFVNSGITAHTYSLTYD